MTKRKTEELTEQDLDEVTGGGAIKPGLTDAEGVRKLGVRKLGVRAVKQPKGFSSTGSGSPTV